jgi:DNA adenine methylase
MTDAARPFLRWAGSKKQILSHLAPFWGNATRYVEPFAGSACLFFRLQPKTAILGDLNRELISTYRIVRDYPELVYSELLGFENSETEYKRVRSLDPAELSKVSRASRFIYLNRFCFNGLYRTNLAGRFNVPYGGERSGSLPSLEQLVASSKLFRKAKLVQGKFQKTLALAKKGDFVYMDPPYSVAARRVFKEYDASLFSQKDILDLRSSLERLAKENISFLVSYAESDEADYLATGFNVKRLSVKRHIAGSFANRIASNEVLIYP